MIGFPDSKMMVVAMILVASTGVFTISTALASNSPDSPPGKSTITIKVKNEPPIISVDPDSPLETCEDIPVEFAVRAVDPDDSVLTLIVSNQEGKRLMEKSLKDPSEYGGSYYFNMAYSYSPVKSDKTTFEEKEERTITLAFEASDEVGSNKVWKDVKITNPCLLISSEPEGKMVSNRDFLLDLDESDSATFYLNLADGCEANNNSWQLVENMENVGSSTESTPTAKSYEFNHIMKEEARDSLKYIVEVACPNPLPDPAQ
jgi:hypothetical protein